MLYVTPRKNFAVRLLRAIMNTILAIASAVMAASADQRALDSLRDDQLEELGLRRRPDRTVVPFAGERP